MDRLRDSSALDALVTASSFLCMAVTATFALTDALCGAEEWAVESLVALLSAAFFLTSLSLAA